MLLDLYPSDTADAVIVDEVGYEGVGVSRIAIADGAHVARGLIQPDTHNTATNGRKQEGLPARHPLVKHMWLQRLVRTIAHLRSTFHNVQSLIFTLESPQRDS